MDFDKFSMIFGILKSRFSHEKIIFSSRIFSWQGMIMYLSFLPLITPDFHPREIAQAYTEKFHLQRVLARKPTSDETSQCMLVQSHADENLVS